MSAQPAYSLSEEAYLQGERESRLKHEFYAGRAYAMAGASEQHNLIAMNIATLLRTHLRGSGCRAYPSDMRLKVMQTGLNTYPDFSIVCGESLFTDTARRDTLLNPIVLIEILSPSTESYDRGDKFHHYRTIATLHEYILVAQNKFHVERFVRQQGNEWLFSDCVGSEAVLSITAIQPSFALADVYEQVEFSAAHVLRDSGSCGLREGASNYE
jgi:Uma2 family endonuclease